MKKTSSFLTDFFAMLVAAGLFSLAGTAQAELITINIGPSGFNIGGVNAGLADGDLLQRYVFRSLAQAGYTNVPMLLDVRQIRGNGRPARFLSDCTGETPMPPVQTKSLPAKGRWY